MNDSDDITLLVRKIAKCERLLKKPPAPGSSSSTSTSKLQKKRTGYVLQLGELAYRAALESPMMLADGQSPTTVTEKLDSSNFAQFHDSLAIFEHPSILTNDHEEGTDDTQPNECNPTLFVVEDKAEEEEQDDEEQHVKMPATMHPSSELSGPIQEQTTTFATASEDSSPLGSNPVDDQDKSFISQSITERDDTVLSETVVDTQSTNEAAMEETLDVDVPDDASLDFLQSTRVADTLKGDAAVDAAVEKASGSEHIDSTDTSAPLFSQHDEENPTVIDAVATKELGDPISIHSVATNESEPRSAAPESIPSPITYSPRCSEFDGEGSVSKLRAMFDSPTGEKPRRSWRPKRVFDAVPPAPLVTSEDTAPTTPIPTSVTMKVQQGSDQPHAIITLHQAVMTSSVHDIDSPLVALVSLFPESLHAYLPKQNRALLIFNALGIEPLYVDGSNPDERERRDELFRLSGKRGVYPQLFVRKQGKLEFFADFDRIELLNDCDTLKEELEAACR